LQAFTVCAPSGRMIWHERFRTAIVDGVDAATVSAEKAIELAADAFREWGAEAGVLRLHLARGRALDFERLRRNAADERLVLDMATVAGRNPAAEQCLAPERVVWRTVDLRERWQSAS